MVSDPSTPITWDLQVAEFTEGHPELTNALMTAFLWGLGDVIAQLLERRTQQRQTHLPLRQDPPRSGGPADYGRPTAWRFDFVRLLRLTVYAGLIFAPATKRWFELLESWFPSPLPDPSSGAVSGSASFAVAMQRMLADQLLYSVCVLCSLFLWSGAWESGFDVGHMGRKLSANLWPSLRANWRLWPAVQLINQSIVPLNMRMLVAALVNIPWTAYLASKAAAPTPATALGGRASPGLEMGKI